MGTSSVAPPVARSTSPGSTPLAPLQSGGRLRVLDNDDLEAASALLARGFAEEPGNLALFPEPEVRRRLSELAIGKELRTSLPYATVHGVEVEGRLAAVAVWHPPNVEPRSLIATAQLVSGVLVQAPVLARALVHLGSTVLRHGPDVPRLLDARRGAVAVASGGRTWHLALLATDPDFRGRGLARDLLEHVLRRCDADGLAAWLETTDPVNPPLYERFGFQTVTHIKDAAWLPGFWVMRRDPQVDGAG